MPKRKFRKALIFITLLMIVTSLVIFQSPEYKKNYNNLNNGGYDNLGGDLVGMAGEGEDAESIEVKSLGVKQEKPVPLQVFTPKQGKKPVNTYYKTATGKEVFNCGASFCLKIGTSYLLIPSTVDVPVRYYGSSSQFAYAFISGKDSYPYSKEPYTTGTESAQIHFTESHKSKVDIAVTYKGKGVSLLFASTGGEDNPFQLVSVAPTSYNSGGKKLYSSIDTDGSTRLFTLEGNEKLTPLTTTEKLKSPSGEIVFISNGVVEKELVPTKVIGIYMIAEGNDLKRDEEGKPVLMDSTGAQLSKGYSQILEESHEQSLLPEEIKTKFGFQSEQTPPVTAAMGLEYIVESKPLNLKTHPLPQVSQEQPAATDYKTPTGKQIYTFNGKQGVIIGNEFIEMPSNAAVLVRDNAGNNFIVFGDKINKADDTKKGLFDQKYQYAQEQGVEVALSEQTQPYYATYGQAGSGEMHLFQAIPTGVKTNEGKPIIMMSKTGVQSYGVLTKGDFVPLEKGTKFSAGNSLVVIGKEGTGIKYVKVKGAEKYSEGYTVYEDVNGNFFAVHTDLNSYKINEGKITYSDSSTAFVKNGKIDYKLVPSANAVGFYTKTTYDQTGNEVQGLVADLFDAEGEPIKNKVVFFLSKNPALPETYLAYDHEGKAHVVSYAGGAMVDEQKVYWDDNRRVFVKLDGSIVTNQQVTYKGKDGKEYKEQLDSSGVLPPAQQAQPSALSIPENPLIKAQVALSEVTVKLDANSEIVLEALKQLGISVTDGQEEEAVKEIQNVWIKLYCSDGNCPGTCIGSMKTGICIPDGKPGDKTKAFMGKQLLSKVIAESQPPPQQGITASIVTGTGGAQVWQYSFTDSKGQTQVIPQSVYQQKLQNMADTKTGGKLSQPQLTLLYEVMSKEHPDKMNIEQMSCDTSSCYVGEDVYKIEKGAEGKQTVKIYRGVSADGISDAQDEIDDGDYDGVTDYETQVGQVAVISFTDAETGATTTYNPTTGEREITYIKKPDDSQLLLPTYTFSYNHQTNNWEGKIVGDQLVVIDNNGNIKSLDGISCTQTDCDFVENNLPAIFNEIKAKRDSTLAEQAGGIGYDDKKKQFSEGQAPPEPQGTFIKITTDKDGVEHYLLQQDGTQVEINPFVYRNQLITAGLDEQQTAMLYAQMLKDHPQDAVNPDYIKCNSNWCYIDKDGIKEDVYIFSKQDDKSVLTVYKNGYGEFDDFDVNSFDSIISYTIGDSNEITKVTQWVGTGEEQVVTTYDPSSKEQTVLFGDAEFNVIPSGVWSGTINGQTVQFSSEGKLLSVSGNDCIVNKDACSAAEDQLKPLLNQIQGQMKDTIAAAGQFVQPQEVELIPPPSSQPPQPEPPQLEQSQQAALKAQKKKEEQVQAGDSGTSTITYGGNSPAIVEGTTVKMTQKDDGTWKLEEKSGKTVKNQELKKALGGTVETDDDGNIIKIKTSDGVELCNSEESCNQKLGTSLSNLEAGLKKVKEKEKAAKAAEEKKKEAEAPQPVAPVAEEKPKREEKPKEPPKPYAPPQNVAGLDAEGSVIACADETKPCEQKDASFAFAHESILDGVEGSVYVNDENKLCAPQSENCQKKNCDDVKGCKQTSDGDKYCTEFSGKTSCVNDPLEVTEHFIEECAKNQQYKEGTSTCAGANALSETLYQSLDFEFRSRVEVVFGSLFDDWSNNAFSRLEYWMYDNVCHMNYYNAGESEVDLIAGGTITQEHNFAHNLSYLGPNEIIVTLGGEKEEVNGTIFRYAFSIQTIGPVHGVVYLYNKCTQKKSFSTTGAGWKDEFVVNNPLGVHRNHYATDQLTFDCDLEGIEECRFDHACLKILDNEGYVAPLCQKLEGDEIILNPETGDTNCGDVASTALGFKKG